jgi:hypothetical protein
MSGAVQDLDSLPRLSAAWQRATHQPFAEYRAGALFLLPPFAALLAWLCGSSVLAPLRSAPALVVAVGVVGWLWLVRRLARGGACGVCKDLSGQTVVVTGAWAQPLPSLPPL